MPDVTFLFFSFSLKYAIDFLGWKRPRFGYAASNWKAYAETNMDSDASDDLNDGLVHHLPRRLLNSTCDSSLLDKGNKQKPVQRTQPPK